MKCREYSSKDETPSEHLEEPGLIWTRAIWNYMKSNGSQKLPWCGSGTINFVNEEPSFGVVFSADYKGWRGYNCNALIFAETEEVLNIVEDHVRKTKRLEDMTIS